MVEMVLGIMIGCVVAAIGFAAVHSLFEDVKKNGLVKRNYEDGEEQKEKRPM